MENGAEKIAQHHIFTLIEKYQNITIQYNIEESFAFLSCPFMQNISVEKIIFGYIFTAVRHLS